MKFLDNLKVGTKLKIEGTVYTVCAMNYFISENDRENWYAKVLLNDKHCLCINPKNNKTLDFGYEVKPFAKKEKFPQTLKYNGKTYKFVEKDYQMVKQLVLGDPTLMEGECLFTNHVNIDDDSETISMGYVPRTKSRADIFLKNIPFKNVKIVEE